MNRGGWEGEEATGKCPAAGDLEDSALSRVLPPSLFKSIAQMNNLVLSEERPRPTAELLTPLSCSDPDILLNLLQRRVEKSIQGQITCFSRTASDAVEDRAQLLPSQAWGEGFPLLLCPVPRSSQAPGKWMDRSSLNFSFHLSQRMGRRMGLTGVPQGAPVCGAKPRPCTNRLHPGLWISGWEDYEGSGTRQPPDSPFPSLEARLQNQVAASPRMLGLLLTYLLEPVGSKREAAADRIATELALHLGLNPQSHQRPLSSANSRDDTQKNATSF